jgi:threonine aldolase
VLCHHEAHIATDECGAPEFYGSGIKLVGLPGEAAKITPDALQHALSATSWGGPHHVSPTLLSLSQATEAGTIYRPDEIRALADIAHAHGMSVHVDGARIANALARMNASPAQATWMAGVDALSFGATKGGAMAAEAVIFFDSARGANMPERRKRAGHLLSKHRFLAAQMEAYLADGLWLKLAHHANAMADRLAAGLAAAQRFPVWPVEANEVFVALTRGSSPKARATTRGRRSPCRRALHSSATRCSCVSSRPLPPLPRRLIASWNSHARRDATPTPKLRPIPGYGCGTPSTLFCLIVARTPVMGSGVVS